MSLRPRKKATRADLSEHHPEVVAALEPAFTKNDEEDDVLKKLAVVLCDMKNSAVLARQSSGIEEIWRRCEEAYVGIDDANRAEFSSMRWAKPMDLSGPVTTSRTGVANSTRSNLFLRLTARYVDAGFAKLAEILFPPDEMAFSFTETPDPELIEARNDKRHVYSDSGVPLMRPVMAGETPPGQPSPAGMPAPPASGPAPGTPMAAPPPEAGSVPGVGGPQAPTPGVAAGPGTPGEPVSAPTPAVPGQAAPGGPGAPQVPLTVADLAEENIQMARKKAKAAETKIYDWMVETSYRAESRKMLFDSARIGVGVIKGPVPKVKRSVAASRVDGKIKVTFKEKIIPESVQVSPWNVFPDPTCGEKLSNGSHLFERDWVSEKQVRDLIKEPGYIKEAILAIITEGPQKSSPAVRDNGEQIESSEKDAKKGKYEIWYFHGFIKKSELDLVATKAGHGDSNPDAKEDDLIPVIATLINDRIIKAVPTVLESGSLPYKSFPWTRRHGHWAGIGIAEQVFAPQRMLNAATRSMLNNAGKSAGSQIVIDQLSIRPANGDWTMTPDKFWYKTGEVQGTMKDVFEIYQIPNVTKELMEIILFALKTAEESTSIPLITQGQTGPETPETLGAAQLQNSNANQLLRSIGYSYDDYVTEPLVIDYYEYLLLDPDVSDSMKGDFNIDAHGSVAMVERAIQDATIAQMGPLTLNPAYGMDPKRWAVQMVKSKKLNPADFKYSPEEQKRLDEKPPPEDPRITAAKITMDGWKGEASIKAEVDLKKVKVDSVVELRKLTMQREIALLGYANQHKMKIVDVEKDLATTNLKIEAEERLNSANNASEGQVKTILGRNRPPAVQVPGRARNGQAPSQNT
jgi:hypothetical protein